MNSIKILDYGMGNCGSIKNMLRYLGAESKVVTEIDGLVDAKAIILPGVGSFDHGMHNLLPFIEILEKKVLVEGVPFLGICLGMQLLLERSDEGSQCGLGWIKGQVKRFDFLSPNNGEALVVPHMGWNEVWPAQENPMLSNTILGQDRFYFVHSFHAVNIDKRDALAYCHYGYDFICGIKKNNIIGVQFHPEKSHKFGKEFFRKFIEFAQC